MPSLLLLRCPTEPPPPPGFVEGRVIELSPEPQVIGRKLDDCQICIEHTTVSKLHARITSEGGRYFIEDLKSRNRTYVNGKEAKPGVRVPLRSDDRIDICDFRFQVCDLSIQPNTNRAHPAETVGEILAGAQPVPDYMASEQINERADNPPSPATDLHSVGVILFQMLTGELPFDAGLPESAKLDAIVNRRFVSCEERCHSAGYSSRL